MEKENTPPGMQDLKIQNGDKGKEIPDLDKVSKRWLLMSSIANATAKTAEALNLSELETWKLVAVAVMERLDSQTRLITENRVSETKPLNLGDFIDKPVESYVTPGLSVFHCPQCRKILRDEWGTKSKKEEQDG